MSEYFKVIRLTAPATEPVTLTEAKKQLQIDHADDDTYITGLISVARDKCEQFCNRLFADATAAVLLDTFPSTGPIYLPLPDVATVDSVAYIDDTNATVAVTDTTYNADFQYLWPASSWPSVTVQGVRVAVTAGPPVGVEAIKHAMLLFITDLYEYRADLSQAQAFDNRAAMILLQPYRVEMGV